MVANEGLLIAHDLIEHQNGTDQIGSLDDELEALGGTWYVRGQHADISRPSRGHSPQSDLASDVLNMARIYNFGVEFHTKVPNTRAHDQDENFREIIQQAKEDINGEIDSEDRDDERLETYFYAALHYMRQGYRKAHKRYESKGRFFANNLFWNIAEVVDSILPVEFEGQQFELKYSMTTSEANCFEYYPEEEYY